jgi:steroid 5-alpha reductase family enzyme
LAQSVLLFLITTPTYVLVVAAKLTRFAEEMPAWDDLDLLAAGGMVVLVMLAFVADQQQWNFQRAKATYQKTARVPAPFKQADLDRGFVASGLWAYSRHPTFAAEQAFWVALYQWSCFTTGALYNWTAVGAVAYLGLFQASTWFTELISAGKYPEYKLYQKLVGKFIPKRGSGPVTWADARQPDGAITKEKEKGASKARQRRQLR